MYNIQKSKFGPYEVYQISDSTKEESISIIPAFGGLINGWRVKSKPGSLELLQNYKTHQELESYIDVNFQGPKLIPYPNRIEGGRYTFHNVNYQLMHSKIGEPNSIHGFICRLPMQVIHESSTKEYASITLQHVYDGSIRGYPFPFDVKLTYELHAHDGLSITTHIKNIGNSVMPFGDGWHPYFEYKQGIAGLELEFHAISKLEINDLGIPTGQRIGYSSFETLKPVQATQLDDCFELKDDNIFLRFPKEGLTLSFWQEMGVSKYNFLQIYTPEDRTSIAIEPMTCAPNAFNSGLGLIEIAPNDSIELKHGIRIIRD